MGCGVQGKENKGGEGKVDSISSKIFLGLKRGEVGGWLHLFLSTQSRSTPAFTRGSLGNHLRHPRPKSLPPRWSPRTLPPASSSQAYQARNIALFRGRLCHSLRPRASWGRLWFFGWVEEKGVCGCYGFRDWRARGKGERRQDERLIMTIWALFFWVHTIALLGGSSAGEPDAAL